MQIEIDQALDLLALHDPQRAHTLRERLERDPDTASVLCDLASQLVAQERNNPAARVFMAALALKPQCIAAHKGLGLLLESAGFFEDAADSFASALELQPTSELHYLLARSLQRAGQAELSGLHYNTALQIDPENVDAWYNLGVLLAAAGQLVEASAAFTQITQKAPSIARAWTSLGAVRAQLSDEAGAIRCLQEAVQLEPDNALAHANLADSLRTRDQVAQARKHAEKALRLEANQVLAALVCARLDLQEGLIEEGRKRLLALLARSDSDQLKGRMLVDLGMAHDRLGDYELAFAASSEGHALLAAQSPASAIDSSAYPRRVEVLAQWTNNALRQNTTILDGAPSPGFLIGFPRSGTTLTEQILAAHPSLHSLDERPFLEQVSIAASELTGLPYPACIDSLDQEQLQTLRELYWQEVAIETGLQRDQNILDKMPLNIVHVGLISRLFPNARLLVALRDPRDCCLSAFMQDFVPNEAMVQFSSLERTTSLYAQVMQLWLDSRHKLKNPWLESRYEDLVEDLEESAKKILNFLDLPWNPTVLDYHEHAARKHISTPSHKDVTKPIFRRALRRWERYQEQLAPYEERLAPFISAFGYR